jgi:hypothetical protein
MQSNSYTTSGDGSNFIPPGYVGQLFKWQQSSDNLGAPKLVPTSTTTIEVFDKFPWTLTPREGRQHIPRAIITEYRQTQSSELRGYLYSIRGKVSDLTIANKVGSTESIAGAFQSLGQVVKTASTITGNGIVGTAIQTAAAATVNASTSVATSVLDGAKKFDVAPKSPGGAFASAMDPYAGLYAVETTGFSYSLPYYTANNMVNVANSWGGPGTKFGEGVGKIAGGISNFFSSINGKTKAGGGGSGSGGGGENDEGGGKGFGKALMAPFEIIGGATDALFGATAGAVQKEELVSYQGSSATEDVDISFYLYNTIDTGDVNQLQRNWELCYILTYQNLPNRKGINFLDAPCLYRIDIPGFKQVPLAYLSNISITNQGNTRLVNLANGEVVNAVGAGPYVKLMPEAYKITLKFTGVLKNSRNLFLFNADPNQKITVTTSLASAF